MRAINFIFELRLDHEYSHWKYNSKENMYEGLGFGYVLHSYLEIGKEKGL
jgi:hypothetical protein